jgi:hypothetical protein
MVRTYKKKTNRGEWNPESMKNAIDAVMMGEMGYKKAAESFQVPQSTLERRVKQTREQGKKTDDVLTVGPSGTIYPQNSNPILVKNLGPITTVFTAEEENLLIDYLFKMEERLFGLTSYDLRILAFQWAEKLGKKHTFSTEKKVAGKDWLIGFKARHPQLTLRKPEPTSAARAAAFNKPNVTNFFTLLTRLVDTHKLTADRIYNCDETGVTVVPKHRSKILSLKGRKQVGVLSSAERGNTVTIEVCSNAAGSYMPPLFIFPRARTNDQLMNDCPPGAWAAFHPSGWMQSDIFFTWFKKFVEWSRATKEKPVLLLLDGHFTHTKNMDVIEHARANGVILLCFPPHCTHRLQPLDVSFMKPLSVFYDQEVSCWLRSNPGRVVSLYQIAKLYGSAFVRAATMSTAINGFRKTGIWPVNQETFSDQDYAPSETTDRPLVENAGTPPNQTDSPRSAAAPATPQQTAAVPDIPRSATASATPQPACVPDITRSSAATTMPGLLPDPPQTASPVGNFQSPALPMNTTPTNENKMTYTKCPTPEDILPIPSCSGLHLKKKSRKHGKTAVLSESPYKNELQAELNLKIEKENKKKEKAKQNMAKRFVQKHTTFNKKSKTLQDKSNHDRPKSKQVKKKAKVTKTSPKRKRDSSSSSEASDAECLYCGYLYSQSSEGWIQCCVCQRWAHCSCAGEEDEDEEAVHVCGLCQ